MVNIIDAIKSINSDAKVTVHETGDVDTSTIVWVDSTPEISKSDIKTKIDEMKTEEENAKIKKETDSSSGKQKLKDLGLTDDEIKALTGK